MKGSRAWCGGTRQQRPCNPLIPSSPGPLSPGLQRLSQKMPHVSVVPDEKPSSYLLLPAYRHPPKGQLPSPKRPWP